MVDRAVDLDGSQITDEYDDVRKVQSSKHGPSRRSRRISDHRWVRRCV